MKEDEAKKKWCPMTRAGSDHAINRSSIGNIPYQAKCIASDCMMWAWDMDITQSELGPRNNGRSKTEGKCGLIR